MHFRGGNRKVVVATARNSAATPRQNLPLYRPATADYGCVFAEWSGGPMRTKVALATLAVLLATASHAEDNMACIAKATEALPRIAGLMVKKTRTRPVPPEIMATWRGQTRPVMVDVDIVASGAAETYSYICVLTNKTAFVRRVMS